MTTDSRLERVQQTAKTLYCERPDWMTFYREILGLHGIVRRTFHTQQALSEFEQTEAFREIQLMLTKLREQGPVAAVVAEPTQVITVRLPKSFHETLRAEAHEHKTSMNKLCISKLLQFIEAQMVPDDLPATGLRSTQSGSAGGEKEENSE